MGPIRLTLDFHIDEPPPIEDLDELVDIVRDVIDKKIGEIDYITEAVTGYDVFIESIDDI